MSTRALSVVGAALVAVLVASPASAQRRKSKSIDDMTHRGTTLASIVENLSKRAAEMPTRSRQGSLLIWLVDNTTEMAKNKQHELLARAITTYFTKDAQNKKGGKIEHAVVLIDAKLALIQKPTSDPAEIAKALNNVAKKPQSAVRDTMGAISACARGFARKRSAKSVILFTVENGDTEHQMEQTASNLRRSKTRLFVISREGLVSDAYWVRRSYETKKHKPIELLGSEAPMQELPWGTLFMIRDPHESAPAGFGIYGMNRLVAESGGAYYLYDPVVAPSSDSRCGAVYNDFRLKQHEPPAVSRAKYSSMVGRSAVWRTVREAWTAAYGMGVVYSLPPKLQGSTSRGKNKTPSRKHYSWSINTLDRAADKAKKDRVSLQGWIDKLEAAAKKARVKTAFDRRAVATADCLRFTLEVSRFNLLQLIHFAELVKVLKLGKPRSELESSPIPAGASDVVVSYWNRTFCQDGIRAMEEAVWLGGAQADSEMAGLCKKLRSLMEKHQATPYEVILKRNAVVVFRLYVPVRGTGTTKRKRESSNLQAPEVTEGSRPARSRSGGASRSGSGVTTTK